MRVRLSLAIFAGLVILFAAAAEFTAAQENQQLTLRFAATVNGAPFQCGQSYASVGTTKATITPTDFRLFVSDIQLIESDGKAVPLALKQDGIWQYKTVALIDFEDGSGPCGNGTKAMHAEVSGSVPRGNYTGVRFTMGVPFELNHGDPTVAPSPLNITAMFWNWQGGYKFLKADMNSTGSSVKPAMQKMAMGHDKIASDGHGGGHGGGEASGFSVHLGSTMCAAASPTESSSACKNPNRVTVAFDKFDFGKNVIVADLGAILSGVNVDYNTPNTSPGCMSFPKDPDCPAVMGSLGLPYDGAPATDRQKFFTMK
jgi:uncharacterized repeat protein (TIGR04052 family)